MRISKLTGLIVLFCFITAANVQAQSWRDLFKNQNTNSSAAGINNKDFVGTWNYSGSAIEFKSDDFLKKAGGVVAAKQIKEKFDEQLSKFGVKPGLVNFTFGTDSTFAAVMNNKVMKGTYLYNPTSKTASFTFMGFFTLDAKVNYKSNQMSVLFDADKLLLVLNYFGERANNPTFKAIAALASSYEGLMLGLEIKKK